METYQYITVIICFFVALMVIVIAETNNTPETISTSTISYARHTTEKDNIMLSDYADSAPECVITTKGKTCITTLIIENKGVDFVLDEENINFHKNFKTYSSELLLGALDGYDKITYTTDEYSECEDAFNIFMQSNCPQARIECVNQYAKYNNCRQYLNIEYRPKYNWLKFKPITIKSGEKVVLGMQYTTDQFQTGQYSWQISNSITDISVGTDLSACGTISSSGYYNITATVESTGTCFTLTNDSIEIQCADGVEIRYSNTSAGYGIDVNRANGYNYTIRDCNIQPRSTSASSPIRFGYGNTQNVYNITIDNNIINGSIISAGTTEYIILIGTSGYGVDIRANITNNIIYGDGTDYSGSDRGDFVDMWNNVAYGTNLKGYNHYNNWVNTSGTGLLIGSYDSNVEHEIYNNTVYTITSYNYGMNAPFDDTRIYNNELHLTGGSTGQLYGGIYAASTTNLRVINFTADFTPTTYNYLRGSIGFFSAVAGLYVENFNCNLNFGTTDGGYYSGCIHLDGTSAATLNNININITATPTGSITGTCAGIYDTGYVNTYTDVTINTTKIGCPAYRGTKGSAELYNANIYSNITGYSVMNDGIEDIAVYRPAFFDVYNNNATSTGRIYPYWYVDAVATQGEYGWAIADALFVLYNQNESVSELGKITNLTGQTIPDYARQGYIDSSGYFPYTYTATMATLSGTKTNSSFLFTDDITWNATVDYTVGLLNSYDSSCSRELNADEDYLSCSVTARDPSDNPILSATGDYAIYKNGTFIDAGSVSELGNGAYYFTQFIDDSYAGAYNAVINMSFSDTDIIESFSVVNSTRVCHYNGLVVSQR